MFMAEGGRVPGRPSRIDNMLAAVASGEVVISTPKVQAIDSAHPGLLDSLIHYADGGRVGGGGGAAEVLRKEEVHHFFYYDQAAATRAYLRSAAGRKTLRELVVKH
jgi:hypothetical protein